MLHRRLISTYLFLAWSACSTLAADFYVAQNTAGNGSGTNSANALSLAWLNTANNWNGVGKISPGDKVHLVGTLSNTLTVLASGTTGNPITFYFEPNAKFSAPTLQRNSGWFNVGGRNWITIDGGSNGVIELTDNGTVAANGGTKTYGNYGVWAISAYGANHITIKNLRIQNMYFRQSISEPIQGSGDGAGIYWSGSDITISNCFVTGCQDTISGVYNNTVKSNLTITACTISNYNHGCTLGSGGIANPVFLNVSITHNTFQGGDMFESPDGQELGLHRNPIFFFNESPDRTGGISNIVVAYNFIKHGVNPKSSTAGTGAMFFDGYNDRMFVHTRIYNNISTLAYPLAWSGGGGFIGGGGMDSLIANNTAVAWQTNGVYGHGEISGGGTNAYVFNNIVISQNGITLATSAKTAGLTADNATCSNLLSGVWSDYNIYNHQGNNSFYLVIASEAGGTFLAGLVDSFSQWRNIYSGTYAQHLDPHSTTATVQLNAAFQPLTNDTVAIGHGTNLTAWGIIDDFAGNPRPATGNWTIGAYERASAQTGAAITVTPARQDFGTVAVGATTDRTFTVQNTSGSTLTDNASATAPFSIVSGGSYSLTAGQSQTVTVRYSPTAAGTSAQSVSFSGGVGASAALYGTAIAPPVVSAITQNSADVGTIAPGLQIYAGSVVQYSGSASDPNGLPLTWQWLYTLNGGPETLAISGTGTVASVNFNYTADTAGNTYVWKLRANNGYSTAESTLTVGVEAPPPAAIGFTFQAGEGVITAPFVLTNGYLSQSVQTTDPSLGGRAAYTFTVVNAGSYVIQALVNAPNDANNSFFFNMDAEPLAPTMICDIPLSSGFEHRMLSWRGNGTDANNQFVPKTFTLSAGEHQLIIRGRESNVQLQSVAILNQPPVPQGFRITPTKP